MADKHRSPAPHTMDPPPYEYPNNDKPGRSINNSDTIISLPEIIVNPDSGDGTEPLMDNFAFSDKLIRRGFMRKVYSLIMVQLLLTAGVIAWFMTDTNLQQVAIENQLTFLGVSATVYFTTFFCVLCCEGPRRKVPYNYVFLFLFTLAMSFMVGPAILRFEPGEVAIAGGATLAIVLALTIFAFQTKIDFTLLSGSLFTLTIVMILFGFVMLFSPFPKLRILYNGLGVLLGCLYLVYDTQLMIGGKHRYTISPEEYVFAAINIYIDIMYIFLKLLRIMRA